MKNLRQSVGRTAAVAALTVGAIGISMTGAHADSARFLDAHRDIGGDPDIHNVQVVNGSELQIRVKHAYLDSNPRSVDDEIVFIDKNRDKPGPELKFRGNLVNGRGQLYQMRDWEVTKKRSCSAEFILDNSRARTTFKVSRACLGDARAVRVAVKGTGVDYGDSRGIVDWYAGPRQFTPWVKRG